jgi:hypothetical protein
MYTAQPVATKSGQDGAYRHDGQGVRKVGKPLSKDGETLMSIIKRVEIELSRNTTFTIMNLSCLIHMI